MLAVCDELGDGACELLGVPTLIVAVPTAADESTVSFTGSISWTLNVVSDVAVELPRIGTEKLWAVTPGANVRVPWTFE